MWYGVGAMVVWWARDTPLLVICVGLIGCFGAILESGCGRDFGQNGPKGCGIGDHVVVPRAPRVVSTPPPPYAIW